MAYRELEAPLLPGQEDAIFQRRVESAEQVRTRLGARLAAKDDALMAEFLKRVDAERDADDLRNAVDKLLRDIGVLIRVLAEVAPDTLKAASLSPRSRAVPTRPRRRRSPRRRRRASRLRASARNFTGRSKPS